MTPNITRLVLAHADGLRDFPLECAVANMLGAF